MLYSYCEALFYRPNSFFRFVLPFELTVSNIIFHPIQAQIEINTDEKYAAEFKETKNRELRQDLI